MTELISAIHATPAANPLTPRAEGVMVPTQAGITGAVKTIAVAGLAGVAAEATERIADRLADSVGLPDFVIPLIGGVTVAAVFKGQQGDLMGSMMAFSAMKEYAEDADFLDFLDG